MRTLNRQRANIVFSHFTETGRILLPGEVSREERIFERDGVLRWRSSSVLGSCKIGSPLVQLLQSIGKYHPRTDSLKTFDISIRTLLETFQDEHYLLWFDPSSKRAVICLKKGENARAQLKAWTHALLLAREINDQHPAEKIAQSSDKNIIEAIRKTLQVHSHRSLDFFEQLGKLGWLIETPALETRPGQRIMTGHLP